MPSLGLANQGLQPSHRPASVRASLQPDGARTNVRASLQVRTRCRNQPGQRPHNRPLCWHVLRPTQAISQLQEKASKPPKNTKTTKMEPFKVLSSYELLIYTVCKYYMLVAEVPRHLRDQHQQLILAERQVIFTTVQIPTLYNS